MSDLIGQLRNALATDRNAFRTPSFVYAPDVVASTYDALSAAVGTPVIFSIKANPNVDLVQRLAPVMAQSGVEVASYKELTLVAARKNTACYVNNPSMTPRLMQAGIGSGAHLVLDSPQQIEALIGLGSARPVKPVLLRANASVVATLRPQGSPIRKDQFGMDWPTLLMQAERLRDTPVRVAGVHLFAGSNSFRAHGLRVVSAAPEMIEALEARLGYPLETMNLGGGFSHRWRDDGDVFTAYREAQRAIPGHVKVMHEAGRALFAECGVFATKVVARKTIEDRQYFVCDGGLAQNFLLCGTENRIRRRPTPIRLVAAPAGSIAGGVVVGGSCSQDDVLGEVPAGMGDPEVGEVIAFENCGAYHATYPGQGFGWPGPGDGVPPVSETGMHPLFGDLIVRLLARRVPIADDLSALLHRSALGLLDSATIIEDPLLPFGELAPIAVRQPLGTPPVYAAIEELLRDVRRDGFGERFPQLIGFLGALQIANAANSEQQARVAAWSEEGLSGAFLMTDAGGSTLPRWRSQVAIEEGVHRLQVDKIWAMFAERAQFMTVVVRRAGAMLPVAYLLSPEQSAPLRRTAQGAPFVNGSTQLAAVQGDTVAGPGDVLASGGPLGVSRFLCQARPRFVLGAIAHALWLIDVGRMSVKSGRMDALHALAAFARSVVDDNELHRHAIDEVLALKFAVNEVLLALVGEDTAMTSADARDLMSFTKLEGSSYHCFSEILSRAKGPRRG